MANYKCTVSKCRIIIQGGGLHSDDRCPHLLREKNFHERHHGFWRSSSFIVMTHGVIRLTQNSSQLCCNTVIVACHHFISSSLNVKESPSCNIWIIIKIILEKNHHEHHGKGILTNHHDLISSRSLSSSHPRSTSRRKATSLWSFRLSLYHWFFIVDFVITLSLISCYPFIIDFSHLIIDFIRKWQFQPRTVMIVLNRKSSSWPAWKVCHHRIFCNGGYISSNCCFTNIAIRFECAIIFCNGWYISSIAVSTTSPPDFAMISSNYLTKICHQILQYPQLCHQHRHQILQWYSHHQIWMCHQLDDSLYCQLVRN